MGGATETDGANLWSKDFFDETPVFPSDVSLVIGNPPWGSIAGKETLAGKWCAVREKPLPDNQIAAAFVWKANEHVAKDGQVCFVLPHGLLFHHSTTALEFQKQWLSHNSIDRVVNLADFRWFLFENATYPAIVVKFLKSPPKNSRHRIDYWAPKTAWSVAQTEIINVDPADRVTVLLGEILRDLNGPDAPQVWKQRFWGTPRDLRLIDRLSLYPRLRDHVRSPRHAKDDKLWIMAVGFQPVGRSDDPEKARTIALPTKNFIPATSDALELFLLPDDCKKLKAPEVTVRSGSNTNTDVFRRRMFSWPKVTRALRTQISMCLFSMPCVVSTGRIRTGIY